MGTKNVKKKRSAWHRSRRGGNKTPSGFVEWKQKAILVQNVPGQDLFLCADKIYTSRWKKPQKLLSSFTHPQFPQTVWFFSGQQMDDLCCLKKHCQKYRTIVKILKVFRPIRKFFLRAENKDRWLLIVNVVQRFNSRDNIKHWFNFTEDQQLHSMLTFVLVQFNQRNWNILKEVRNCESNSENKMQGRVLLY